jgi:hypothetical protein
MKEPQRNPQQTVPLTRTPLTAPNLQAISELADFDKAQLIKSFLISQRSYHAEHEKEGRKHRAAWDKNTILTDVSETTRTAGAIGFMTPVLKARVPKENSDVSDAAQHHVDLLETSKTRITANTEKSEPRNQTKEDPRTSARPSSPKPCKRTLEDFGIMKEKRKENKKRKRAAVKVRENEDKARTKGMDILYPSKSVSVMCCSPRRTT